MEEYNYENGAYWAFSDYRKQLVEKVVEKLKTSYNEYISKLDSDLMNYIVNDDPKKSEWIEWISQLRTSALIIKQTIIDTNGQLFMWYGECVPAKNWYCYYISNTVLQMMLEQDNLIHFIIGRFALSHHSHKLEIDRLCMCCTNERCFEEDLYTALDLAVYKKSHGIYEEVNS